MEGSGKFFSETLTKDARSASGYPDSVFLIASVKTREEVCTKTFSSLKTNFQYFPEVTFIDLQ